MLFMVIERFKGGDAKPADSCEGLGMRRGFRGITG
jgi:hypothetical protein